MDVLIINARVFDGTGQPWFPANIAINGDKIVAVGGAVNPPAKRRIDAQDMALAPGFIDVHTHADRNIEAHPAAVNFLRQGVTTVVSGNCGGSKFPIRGHLDAVAQVTPAVNYAILVGHGEIRGQVMGMAGRPPTRKELTAMCRLAEQAMRDGAIGMSSGLFYVPGVWAQHREMSEICRVIADWGGVYATHKRSAGGKVFEAITEAAEVGRDARIPVQISHLKALHRRGRTAADRMQKIIHHIRRYREEGIDITWDVHPYSATNTTLSSVVIPEWVSEGGKLIERLRDSAVRRRIYRDVGGKIAWMGGADKIAVVSSSYNGKNLAQIARARKTDPVETAMDIVIEVNPSCIFHALRQQDVDMALTADLAMIASDGGVIAPDDKNLVHPRNFGTFPRVLGEYARERRLLDMETAVSKMTLMPARKFRLAGRGQIAPGMMADIVIFDPKTVGSKADFKNPKVFPDGILRVLVNGQTAWLSQTFNRS